MDQTTVINAIERALVQVKARLKLSKPMFIMLVSLLIFLFLIFGYKAFGNFMMKKYMSANASPSITVSAEKVGFKSWQFSIKASGSLRAVFGVDVTSEVTGMVSNIHFKPGADVNVGDVLVDLKADTEIAQLHVNEAAAELAQTVYNRDLEQFQINAISKATLDADSADLKSKQAQVDSQRAVVNKKKITAPFSGRLGVSSINPGQYINPGDKIVTLQSLKMIYADFYVPQQNVAKLAIGQNVTLKSDAYPAKTFVGTITTIDPKVDPATRNIQVEATIPNPDILLLPGMFVTVEVSSGKPKQYLTLPQTAVSFNSYGDIVYIIKEKGKDQKGNPGLTAVQTFVKLGETRGDQIVVISGVNEGDRVVTSGQLKLKNGSPVVINNSIELPNKANPVVPNEN